MGWSIGFDENWSRDIGYGVPAVCDHPKCNEKIHRGLSFVCGGEPYGGEKGCGLYFCGKHLAWRNTEKESPQLCPKCRRYDYKHYKPKSDTAEWVKHKLTDSSWQQWRDEKREEVQKLEKDYGLKAKGIEIRETF